MSSAHSAPIGTNEEPKTKEKTTTYPNVGRIILSFLCVCLCMILILCVAWPDWAPPDSRENEFIFFRFWMWLKCCTVVAVAATVATIDKAFHIHLITLKIVRRSLGQTCKNPYFSLHSHTYSREEERQIIIKCQMHGAWSNLIHVVPVRKRDAANMAMEIMQP